MTVGLRGYRRQDASHFRSLTFWSQDVPLLHAIRGRHPGSGFFYVLLRDFLIGKAW